MKENKLRLFALLACCMAMFTFTSCVQLGLDTEEEAMPEEVVVKKLPVSIARQSPPAGPYTDSILFTYDEQNRLTEVNEIFYGYVSQVNHSIVRKEYKKIFTYTDETNRPSEEAVIHEYSTPEGYHWYFSYPDNLTVELRTNPSSARPYQVLELSDKEQIEKDLSYLNSPIRPFTLLYYYDRAGNVLKETIDSYSDTIFEPNIHTFDSKRGIFSGVNAPYWFLTYNSPYIFESQGHLFMVNNVLTLSNDGITGTAVYEYDADGYPVKISFHNRFLYIDGVNEGEGERDEVYVIKYKGIVE